MAAFAFQICNIAQQGHGIAKNCEPSQQTSLLVLALAPISYEGYLNIPVSSVSRDAVARAWVYLRLSSRMS
eukprot:6182982-Pleurochrysis_carterae.AAC.2